MGLFFDVKTPADQKLLNDYDTAILRFREEVSKAMDEAAAKEPSIAVLMRTAAAAMRSRPLPSEANNSEDALKRVTMSTMTIELAFSKLQSYADSEQAMATAMGVIATMREVGKTTSSAPQFLPITQAVLRAAADRKADVQRDMDATALSAHVAELKRLAAPKPATKKNNFQP